MTLVFRHLAVAIIAISAGSVFARPGFHIGGDGPLLMPKIPGATDKTKRRPIAEIPPPPKDSDPIDPSKTFPKGPKSLVPPPPQDIPKDPTKIGPGPKTVVPPGGPFVPPPPTDRDPLSPIGPRPPGGPKRPGLTNDDFDDGHQPHRPFQPDHNPDFHHNTCEQAIGLNIDGQDGIGPQHRPPSNNIGDILRFIKNVNGGIFVNYFAVDNVNAHKLLLEKTLAAVTRDRLLRLRHRRSHQSHNPGFPGSNGPVANGTDGPVGNGHNGDLCFPDFRIIEEMVLALNTIIGSQKLIAIPSDFDHYSQKVVKNHAPSGGAPGIREEKTNTPIDPRILPGKDGKLKVDNLRLDPNLLRQTVTVRDALQRLRDDLERDELERKRDQQRKRNARRKGTPKGGQPKGGGGGGNPEDQNKDGSGSGSGSPSGGEGDEGGGSGKFNFRVGKPIKVSPFPVLTIPPFKNALNLAWVKGMRDQWDKLAERSRFSTRFAEGLAAIRANFNFDFDFGSFGFGGRGLIPSQRTRPIDQRESVLGNNVRNASSFRRGRRNRRFIGAPGSQKQGRPNFQNIENALVRKPGNTSPKRFQNFNPGRSVPKRESSGGAIFRSLLSP